ncbi:hypothetical protein AAFF_G00001770 [Aldrovandia affinis]|uniref:Uncharacterized protein n=1 Tax=Aldrovandia affinis TaxID=143900 RepID=A0AAD7X3G2_9TELE|nr:hypothetical protein AAFF_G00001770 [Aldrovandia affinis]
MTWLIFPLGVVSGRAYVTGWLMSQKKSFFLIPSAVLRLIVLISTLMVLPYFGVHGGTLGVGALLAGYLGECIMVLVVACYCYISQKQKKNKKMDESAALDWKDPLLMDKVGS